MFTMPYTDALFVEHDDYYVVTDQDELARFIEETYYFLYDPDAREDVGIYCPPDRTRPRGRLRFYPGRFTPNRVYGLRKPEDKDKQDHLQLDRFFAELVMSPSRTCLSIEPLR